jgi:hypothetical protein
VDTKNAWLVYELTLWSNDVFEKLTVAQPVKKFPTFYGTTRFIIVFTKNRYWTVSWARWRWLSSGMLCSVSWNNARLHGATSLYSPPWEPKSYQMRLIHVLIPCLAKTFLMLYVCFLKVFRLKFLHWFLVSHACYVFYPSRDIDLVTRIIRDEEYKIWISSLCNFPHTPVTSSLLGPNILLSTLLWNAISLCYSLMWEKFHTHTKQ